MNARQLTRTLIGNALVAAGLAAVVTVATPAHAGLLGQGSGSLGGSLGRGGLEGMASGQGRLEAMRPELRRPGVADRALQLRDRGTQTATDAAVTGERAGAGASERVGDRAEDTAGRSRGALGSLGQRAGAAGAGAQGEASGSGQATIGAMRSAEMPAVTAPAMPAMPAMPTAPAMAAPATPAPSNMAPSSGSTRTAPAAQPSGRRSSMAADGDAQAQASRQGGGTQVQAQGAARASAESRGN